MLFYEEGRLEERPLVHRSNKYLTSYHNRHNNWNGIRPTGH